MHPDYLEKILKARVYDVAIESPLEAAEACDSNRMCDHGGGQVIAPYPFVPSYSVDSPADAALVEAAMQADPLWGRY